MMAVENALPRLTFPPSLLFPVNRVFRNELRREERMRSQPERWKGQSDRWRQGRAVGGLMGLALKVWGRTNGLMVTSADGGEEAEWEMRAAGL